MWIVSNRKEERRRGKVQLIDATDVSTPLRKNLGNKNCEVTEENRKEIIKLLMDFEQTEKSKIFDNREFGYWQITVQRPLREHIRIDKENLQRAVAVCIRRDVEFSQEAIDALAELGIDANSKDNLPVANFSDALTDKLEDDVRSFKLPKTKGQIAADTVLSVAMVVLAEKAKGQTLYMDYDKFEEDFNKDARVKAVKLKFSNIADIFYYLVERDPKAEPRMKAGKVMSDPKLKDSEQVPLLYEGGIDAFMENEVLPYAPDAYVDEDATLVGYELSFTKYFYKPVELRSINDIKADIRSIEKNTDGLLDEILGEL